MISVIVPVYNTREYLTRCVNSLLAQTYADMEILLVDDGSTDGSGELCEQFAAQSPQVRVFRKENGGSSSARNLGIDNARGDYLGFVDSDDYVDADMYERLYAGIRKYRLKAAQIGRNEIGPDGSPLPDICIPPAQEECIAPEAFMRELLMHRGDCSFCTKLLSRELFFPEEAGRERRFPVGVLNEDFHLLIQMLEETGPVISLPGYAYHVVYRLGSNSRKESRENFSRVFADNVDNADLAGKIVARKYPRLAAVAFRFGIYQRLDYMLHIPVAQMKRENQMYGEIRSYLRKNWAKAMKNPFLTGKNKLYHTLFALAPRTLRKLHGKLRGRKNYLAGFLAAVLFLTGVFTAAVPVRADGNRYPAGMDAETALFIDEAGEALGEIAAEREIMALVYLADEYPVRTEPSFDSAAAITVLSGQLVNILDVYVDEEFQVWEYVELEYEGVNYYGYVPRTNLAVSDARFLRWEEAYGMNPGSNVYTAEEESGYPDIEAFPESYRPALLALKEQHPSWTFVKMNTTLNWDAVIYAQLQGGKSLVHKSLPDWAKNGLYDTGNWYYATEAAVKVYMDPRNSLTENAVFQFEQLTYNEQYHTLEAMQTFLNNTFMNDSKPAPGMDTMTFAELFWYLGKEEVRKVSPFHLAARVLQEQGQGNSPLISGTYPGYEGYYNYFNIGASGTTNEEIYVNGLQYAKDHGWAGAYFSIQGGADFISANYIKKGQDTLYLQKFNVNPNGSYPVHTHQYMQNISAPTSEALSMKRLYAGANSLDSTFVFKIPVYENMPAKPCAAPGTEEPDAESLAIALELPEGYTEPALWLDGVAYRGTLNGRAVTVTAPDKNARAAVAYRYNESGVPTGMYVWSLKYDNGSYIAQAEPELEDLLTYHGFSIRITGKSGIRFKTGISADLRSRLTSAGVNDYRLLEYGTLVMNDANREQYPMVKGGAKVQSGMAYGADGNGGFTDVVYETVEGRYRYTSVLVGMPASQYKTAFAFRGYIVLERNGETVTLYGPAMARSIYSLAEQLLERGSYEPGSEAYEFLTQLIQDGDNSF